METASSMTPSGRSQRRKTLTLKAKENLQTQKCFKEDTSLNDYSDSPSEYSGSESSSSSSSLLSSEQSEEIDEEDPETESATKLATPKSFLVNKIDAKKTRKQSNGKAKVLHSYTIKTEDYFYNNSLKKGHTSNHTLDKLNKPRLSQDELQKLLSKMTVSDSHSKNVKDMYVQNTLSFEKWLCLLHEGFNILLYGLGSKHNILNSFQTEYLSNEPVIVVNGFFPSLTIKDILDSIIMEILELTDVPGNIFEAVEIIQKGFQHYPNLHLYLIIHNIEGEALRSNLKNQTVLANLSVIDNIHLIASIDHISAPLIWDQNKLSKFNFTWWDVTTFMSYKNETSFETSMMITKTGSLALSSLRNVFLSLTSNSKGIYLIIVKHQLENTNQYYQGILFKDLYWASREAFLVSSDLALRAQLTEFIDHKMIKFRRSVDGAEHLIIPIPNNLLQQFLNDQ